MKTKLVTLGVTVVLVVTALYLSGSDRMGGSDGDSRGIAKDAIELAGNVSLTSSNESGALEQNMLPPDFYISPSTGETVTLSGLEGKSVFINFWYTGCGYCRAEMADLERLYREYGDNVEFILINMFPAERSVDGVANYLSENDLTIPVYLDREGEVTTAYGVKGFPTSLVVNSKGELIYAAAGQISYDKAKSLITE